MFVKFFWTLTDNVCTMLTGRNPSRAPLFLSINLTYDCNAKCNYCNTHELKKKLNQKLSSDELCEIIENYSSLGTCMISFTGGEPIVYPELNKLLRKSKDCNLFVNLNTNGLAPKLLSKIDLSLVDRLTISLDSLNPADFLKIGKPLQSIDLIKRSINLATSKNTKVLIRTIVKKDNLCEVEKILKFCKESKLKISLQPINNIDISSMHFFKESKKTLISHNFLKSYRKLYCRNIFTFKSKVEFFYISHFLMFKNKLINRYKCYAGFLNSKIDITGNVYNCSQMIFKLGSLKSNTPREVLLGKEYVNYRKRNKRLGCICFTSDNKINTLLNQRLYLRSK